MSAIEATGPILPPLTQFSYGNQPFEGWNYLAYGDIYWALNGASHIVAILKDAISDPQIPAAFAKMQKLYNQVTQYTPPPPPKALCEQLIGAMKSFVSLAQNTGVSGLSAQIGVMQSNIAKFQAYVNAGEKKWTPS